MKKGFLLLLASLLLTACLSEEADPNTSDSQTGETSEQEMTTLETVVDGTFSFTHKTQGESYYVDVHYKDQIVGQFFKELPADGWNVYVFETTTDYAYLGLEPTGLGGYIPFGGPWELARVNLETSAFETIIFNGRVSDLSADDSKLAYFSDVLPNVSVMDIATARYPNGSNVTNYVPEGDFDYAGDAVFSTDGTQLAYVALNGPDEESSAIFLVDLATGAQTSLASNAGQLKITGWTGAEPSYE